jgi:hypothetical protein
VEKMKLKKLAFLVIGVIFIMLVFPSCNNDNIIVTYDYNKSPNTVNILSDHDIGRINLNFKVTTKEFGEKNETISIEDIKEFTNKKVELTTKYDNKDVTIENIEYTGYSLSPTESDIVVHIICICILIAIGLICWRIRKD